VAPLANTPGDSNTPGAMVAALTNAPSTPRLNVSAAPSAATSSELCESSATQYQGLTLVHFSAQLERLLWNRGCVKGMCSPLRGF